MPSEKPALLIWIPETPMPESSALVRAIQDFVKLKGIPVEMVTIQATSDVSKIRLKDKTASYRLIMECTAADPVFRYYRAGPVPSHTLAVVNWPFRQPETEGCYLLTDAKLAVGISPLCWQQALLRHCSGESPGRGCSRQLGFGF